MPRGTQVHAEKDSRLCREGFKSVPREGLESMPRRTQAHAALAMVAGLLLRRQ